ncbi:hypothetical protein RFI_28090 [Reticulomyxa filosa]|uniref:Uncharacterized protein n=1 Tax=Reticulomyxa filosa TaxID=46433 RepID=X6M751_RETFI|nr:hypothetical protein RFI_28090 [Reticulomyxa filosa]|eukprot:ETO09297.1 hypothetical protein RFI_28090 [Reticulomyxa filosa]
MPTSLIGNKICNLFCVTHKQTFQKKKKGGKIMSAQKQNNIFSGADSKFRTLYEETAKILEGISNITKKEKRKKFDKFLEESRGQYKENVVFEPEMHACIFGVLAFQESMKKKDRKSERKKGSKNKSHKSKITWKCFASTLQKWKKNLSLRMVLTCVFAKH